MFRRPRWTEGGCCSSSSVKRRCCHFSDRLSGKFEISTLLNGKRNANGANVIVLVVSPLAKGSWHRGLRAPTDWSSEIQACFRKAAEDFLDAKFQTMLWSEDSPLSHCVTLIELLKLRVPHLVTPSEYILRGYVRRFVKISQANSKRTS